MKLVTILAASVVLIMSIQGCAFHVSKRLVPTGGSRADGIIKMCLDYRRFEIPQTDFDNALSVAIRRCAAWGYKGAEAFEGHTTTCIDPSFGGCQKYLLTYEYQCTDNPTEISPSIVPQY